MMIPELEAHASIIDSYEVLRYRLYERAHEFQAAIRLRDDSVLHVRDYLFLDGSRKYAYDSTGELITRWDNAHNFPDHATFPNHVHDSQGVHESRPLTLERVLEAIRNRLEPNE